MLELTRLCKRYDHRAVLNDISLTIKPCATTVFIGPSGCGKSTLLKLMLGLVAPDQGDIRWQGETLTARNRDELRRQTGYVIQEGGLFPHMTVQANVAIMAKYLGWDRQRRRRRVEELCRLTNLDHALLERYPNELSGGQRQRVSLMRALMLDPALLLFDEPLGALDPLIRHDMQQELKTIFQTLNKTVIWVTHDLVEAHYIADTVILFNEGRIEQQGTIDELMTHPASSFVKRFVNAQRAPAMDGST